MHVRAARTEDIGFMRSLAAGSPEAAQWTESAYQQIFTSSAPLRHCVVAEQGLVGMGFIVARELGPAVPPHPIQKRDAMGAPEWEIENVVVAKSSRRRGVGSQLVREILALARASGAQTIFLEVRESNQPARRLYESCGFATTGRRSKYYSAPEEDAVLFRLTFPQAEKNPSSDD